MSVKEEVLACLEQEKGAFISGEALAQRLGVAFGDTAGWDIPLLFDGVHFSPEGHHRFAEHLAKLLAEQFPEGF